MTILQDSTKFYDILEDSVIFYKTLQDSLRFCKILHESTRFCNILSANRNDNEYQIRETKSCYQSFRELHLAAKICKIDRNYKKLCLGILSDVKVDMTDTTRHDTTRHDTTITGLRDDEQQLRYSSSKNLADTVKPRK